MKTLWLPETLAYDGSQLRAHWILRQTGLVGDALVAFRGPCAVRPAEMADLEDLLAGEAIEADDMLHLIMEVFDDGDILRAVYWQRLLTVLCQEAIQDLAPGQRLRRQGDDLYLAEGKLSVSIATRSPVSTLTHLGLNLRNEGTPEKVQTACLADLGIQAEALARQFLDRAQAEHISILAARAQVRGKGEA